MRKHFAGFGTDTGPVGWVESYGVVDVVGIKVPPEPIKVVRAMVPAGEQSVAPCRFPKRVAFVERFPSPPYETETL